MSIQAVTWALYGVPAESVKYSDFRVLLVLADHADPEGRGAYPSRSTISRLTGYGLRTVSYALKNLENAGLISRGDQRITSNLGGYKPVVWNLSMGKDRGAKIAPLGNGERGVQSDCTPAVQSDCTPAVQRGVQKTADRCANSSATCLHKNQSKEEPYIEPRESNARARKSKPISSDWKPSEEHRALADRLGIDCDVEASKFIDRALDSGAGSADWDARFRTWLKRGAELGYATSKAREGARRYTWASDEVRRVLGPVSCEGTDTYMSLACKVADLLNHGVDPETLRRQLADVPGDVLAEQLFEQEAAA
ncbi:helix-turn-helix domain-containing protein [Bifidobacterium dentium]|uniref:helix-turn-helix domain-containing protein n=1 Tax=Bifidobacterium dentium TaxID=1689 RepID=UPI0018B04949|nr:helix-turn-helix domain-containing protein [Bifidobacterium dentium]MBF9694093.1 helix-turn-helix domain-containing protein [Bifidobacterium dentium]